MILYYSESKQRPFLRQSVSLSGLGSQSFSSAIEAIQEIHQMFGRTFAAGTLEQWTPNEFEGTQAIDVANRYFTPRHQATQDQITPFSPLVDPDSVLTTAMECDGTYTHTIDNEVDYYELMNDSKGLIR